MSRIDATLQPGETVVWRNRPGLGFGTALLIGLAIVAALLAVMAWLGGGWQSLFREPYRLIPLAALVVIGGQRSADAVAVTDRRLLLTRGLLRRTVAEVDRADILSARVTATIPYCGQVVTVRCRDTASVRLYRADAAGAATLGQAEFETILSKEAEALCEALGRPGRPWGDDGARGRV